MNGFEQLFYWFHKGGLVMYPLLLSSVAVVAIAVERWQFFHSVDSGSRFLQEVTVQLQHGDWKGAQESAANGRGVLAKTLMAVFERPQMSKGETEAMLNTRAALVVADLRKRIGYLGVMVTMSPLWGLLGTVVGMITSFNVFALQSGAPHAITGGVGEALIATATGLCVALVSLMAHSFFAQWLDSILSDMEKCFAILLEAMERRNDHEAA